MSFKPVINYTSGGIRKKSTIFEETGGFITKIEKNSNGDTIRITSYDAPIILEKDLVVGDTEMYYTKESDANLGYYFEQDNLMLREEDGSVEPLSADHEELVKVLSVDKVHRKIMFTAPIVNDYTKNIGVAYSTIISEKFVLGLDKLTVAVEMWKNS